MLVSDEIRVQLWSMTPSALLQGATQADQKGADRFDHRKLLKWATNLTSAWKPTCSSIKWTIIYYLCQSNVSIIHFSNKKLNLSLSKKLKTTRARIEKWIEFETSWFVIVRQIRHDQKNQRQAWDWLQRHSCKHIRERLEGLKLLSLFFFPWRGIL